MEAKKTKENELVVKAAVKAAVYTEGVANQPIVQLTIGNCYYSEGLLLTAII